MSLHRLVETFSRECVRCATSRELFCLTETAAQELGFTRLAMVHGMWFRCPDRQLIRMDNFGEWADIFIERKYYLDDPVLLACQRNNAPMPWSDLAAYVAFGPKQTTIMAEAKRHGLRNGLALPFGVMGEPTGCCSFTCEHALPSRWHCRAAALIGADAFREARRLHGFPARAHSLPKLSRRKLQCLRLIAIGKSDPLIAQILGLSTATVRTYVAMLRRDFDVVSRQQLAVEALRFGLLSHDDAIPSS
jgi:DNA-binding CsgD family transcriptional regulator